MDRVLNLLASLPEYWSICCTCQKKLKTLPFLAESLDLFRRPYRVIANILNIKKINCTWLDRLDQTEMPNRIFEYQG